MEREAVTVTLKYEGRDVEDGSIEIEDMISALEGFSGAYEKALRHYDRRIRHRIRVQRMDVGSWDLVLSLIEVLSEHKEEVTSFINPATAVPLAFWALEHLRSLIDLVKHIGGSSYNVQMGDNNDVSIGNTYNQTFIVDPDTFKLFQSGEVKEDLGKFVKPLMEGKIETGSIIYRGTDGAEKESVVSYAEKALFTTEREEIIKERRWQAGRFMSHHKATDKGRLVLDNAQQVSYAFKMGDPHNYYRYYIFDGSVRVFGDFYMDETGQVQRVDIYNVEELEQDMFIPSGAE